ncbi:O-antigen ligase family protein [Vreelandella populi]|uniref:O-antigen ligase family protein n=1 Tax=Vreelandella populi TaxID=2498858 RepID=A0A3S0YM74_9GAMM|nr:O-antigen ligase [Halomonas populi]RUR42371.1 O-antigen ligase family protein [Halomonas populi]RUR46024.1 O-antigen ligase family protein [Halomonas populi]
MSISAGLKKREDDFFNKSIRVYIALSVFFMGSVALVVPSGYSVGPLLLLLGSASLLLLKPNFTLSNRDYWIVGVLGGYALIVGGMSFVEDGARGLDRPVRFLLAIPVLLLIIRFPPRLASVWSGLAVGTCLAGGWAIWQKIVEGVERAEGYTHVIQFGNLSMLMGVICFAGVGWAFAQPHRYAWGTLLIAGGAMGMLGSLLSGSRGGWIGLPVVAFILYQGYGKKLPNALKVIIISGVIAAGVAVYSIPQTGVQERVHAAFNDLSHYYSDENRDTSLGLRFEMWRGASQLILQRPLYGWGESGYREAMAQLGEQGQITHQASQFGHAHNEYIDALAKRGLIGLAALLALYFIPLRLFASGLQHPNLEIRSVAMAGTLLAVGYIDFGLSQTFLAHNSGVMFYPFWLSLLWGCYSVLIRKHEHSA